MWFTPINFAENRSSDSTKWWQKCGAGDSHTDGGHVSGCHLW